MSENSEKSYYIEDLIEEPYCVAELESGELLVVRHDSKGDGIRLALEYGSAWTNLAIFENFSSALRTVKILMAAKEEGVAQKDTPRQSVLSNKEFLELVERKTELETKIGMYAENMRNAEEGYEDVLREIGRAKGTIEGLKWAMERTRK